MSHRHALAVFLSATSFALAACGPEESIPSFAGHWYGTATASTAGQPVTYNATLTIADVQDSTDVSGICPDGSGTVPAARDGATLRWSGLLRCPWPPGPACSTSILTYTNADAFLTPDATLVVGASGVLVGCGYSTPVNVSFHGRR